MCTHLRGVWVVLLRALPSQGPLGEAKGRPVKGNDTRARSGLRKSWHHALPARGRCHSLQCSTHRLRGDTLNLLSCLCLSKDINRQCEKAHCSSELVLKLYVSQAQILAHAADCTWHVVLSPQAPYQFHALPLKPCINRTAVWDSAGPACHKRQQPQQIAKLFPKK